LPPLITLITADDSWLISHFHWPLIDKIADVLRHWDIDYDDDAISDITPPILHISHYD
jgi:hypothetical protein